MSSKHNSLIEETIVLISYEGNLYIRNKRCLGLSRPRRKHKLFLNLLVSLAVLSGLLIVGYILLGDLEILFSFLDKIVCMIGLYSTILIIVKAWQK